jgi:E3 ubiquitin-protein ligase RNF14
LSIAKTQNGQLLNMRMPVALSRAYDTTFEPTASHASSSTAPSTLAIEYLPPLIVSVELPASYPVFELPKVTSIIAAFDAAGETQGSWLSRAALETVIGKLKGLWEEEKEIAGEGQGVLWRWWEWVGTGEFLTELGFIKDGQLR